MQKRVQNLFITLEDIGCRMLKFGSMEAAGVVSAGGQGPSHAIHSQLQTGEVSEWQGGSLLAKANPSHLEINHCIDII